MRAHYSYVEPVPHTFTIVFGHAVDGTPQHLTTEGWANSSTRYVREMLLGALAFWAQDEEQPTTIRILICEVRSSSIAVWGEWGDQLANETGVPVAQSMPGYQILVVGAAVVDGRMTFEYRIQSPNGGVPRGGGWQQRLPDRQE